MITEDSIVKLIPEAEKLLLPKGANFDCESKEFLKCLETKDIIACPGSGKTTVLLAKLFILSKFMPFEDNSGICVLTHTNVAIDEIKARMGKESSVLFRYPNYFGTIQGFVDMFLLRKAAKDILNVKPSFIDNNRFENQVLNEIFCCKANINEVFKNGYVYANLSSKEKKLSWAEQYEPKLKFLFDFEPIWDYNGEYNYYFNNIRKKKVLKDHSTDTFKFFDKYIMHPRIEGYFRYSDAFSLSTAYFEKYQTLKDIFSKRFKYVFFDEMQDTKKQQIELIDKLFEKSIVQKIGDTNQAIFGSSVKSGCDWNPDEDNLIRIKKSKRFSCEIAKAIKSVSIIPDDNLNGIYDREIKPKIILYNDPSEVLPKFVELIHENIEKWKNIPENKHIYKAVGWIHEKEDLDKLSIKSYWLEYNKPSKLKNSIYSSFLNYIIKQEESEKNEIAKPIYGALIDCFLQILNISNRKNENDTFIRKNASGETILYLRSFTKTSLLSYLFDLGSDKLDDFLSFCAKLSLKIYQHKKCNDLDTCPHKDKLYPGCIIDDAKEYIKNKFCVWMDIKTENIDEFLSNPLEEISDDEKQFSNFYINDSYPNIKIKVGSVHSIKGETHTATLLMETFFNKKYESQRLAEYICGNHTIPANDDLNKSLKTAYVALSRPTHLLCFALSKNRAKCLNTNHSKCLKFNSSECNWEIIEI